jgi:uncharacterized membrane protein
LVAWSLVFAALAAVCNAGGDLLQRGSARHETSTRDESVRLIGRLLRRPAWLFGLLSSLLGLALHLVALALGEVTTVQPVLVVELPLAVLGAAWFFGRKLTNRDRAAIAVLAVGLALFVFSLSPSGGRRLAVPGGIWAIGLAVVIAAVLGLACWAWRAEGELRAGLLGTAAGMGYGLTGVLFATAGQAASTGGPAAAIVTWQGWAAVCTGGASFYLLQNALAAGSLVAVEPGLTLANPLVAVVWGLVVFGETGRMGFALIGTVAGAVLLVVGVLLLVRSPVLSTPDTSQWPRGAPTARVTSPEQASAADAS